MSYPINYPTPQGANVQIFQAPTRLTTNFSSADWVKPQGASFVWFTLIGAGGATDDDAINLLGGGSGAVTNCMVPAFLIPDVLQVRVGKGGYYIAPEGTAGRATEIRYQQKDGIGYDLLTANGGDPGATTGAGGTASVSNYFSAIGFFQSIAGQDGVNGTQSPSATTFLSGGSYTNSVTANYGYSGSLSFIQPIIVAAGGGTIAGFGCGGSGSTSSATRGVGGDGLVVIITW
jgi:hypothetical protein